MSLALLVILGYCFIPPFTAEGYKYFDSDGLEESYCMDKGHMILNTRSTCCKMTVIKPNIKFEENWVACTNEPKEDASNAQTAAWSVYGCIIQKSLDGDQDSISVAKFAELISQSYPEKIKEKIIEKTASLSTVSASFSDWKALEKVRLMYYDVEWEVCAEREGLDGGYGKSRECTAWEEEDHRGGSCCKSTAFPFDVGFQSLIASPIQYDICNKSNLLEKVLVARTATEGMVDSIYEICDLACQLVVDQKLPEAWLLEDASNFKAVTDIFIPKWLPFRVQHEVFQKVVRTFSYNDTKEMMGGFDFPDTVPGSPPFGEVVYSDAYVNNTPSAKDRKKNDAIDFMGRKFPKRIVDIPTRCAIYKQLLGFVNMFLYTDNCEEYNPGTSEPSEKENKPSTGDEPPPDTSDPE